MRQQLESMMDSYQPMASEQRQTTYFVVGDLESLSASALYGDMDRRYDFKASGFQFHFHENKPNEISSPKLKVGNKTNLGLSNYEAAMGDYYAQQLSLPQVKKGS
jgi:hypothetical protein